MIKRHRLHSGSSLLALVFLAAPARAADVDPYPQGPVIGQRVARFDFVDGIGRWRALHDCRIAAAGGLLRIESTGGDPYLALPLEKPLPGPLLAKIRIRGTTAGKGQFFWGDDRHPGTAADRVSDFDLSNDDQWHESSTFLDVDGSLNVLRLDPGNSEGHVEVAWIELYQAQKFPLAIERLETTLTAIHLAIRNQASATVKVAVGGRVVEIPAGQTVDATQPVAGRAAIEAVPVRVEVEGFPPLQRTVVVRRPAPTDDWLCLQNEQLTVRVAPDGGMARLERNGRLAAVLAPLVLAEGNVVRFTSLQRQGHVMYLKGATISVILDLQQEQLGVAIDSRMPVEGPVVRPIGGLEQGLLAGLEYLGRGEQSSSTRDIETAEHLRFRPDLLKLTLPLAACVTDRASVAMTWTDSRLQPTYACPNFVDGYRDEHRMSVCGRNIGAVIRVANDGLEDAILWAVRCRGLPPLPPAPRDAQAQRALALAAIRGPLSGPGGWGHCIEPHFTRHPFADVASALFRLTGEVPPLETLIPGGAHVRNDVSYFVTGRGKLWLQQRRGEIQHLIHTQQPDGSYRYAGEYRRGHDEDTASGCCALPAMRLLEFAQLTGDAEALAAGMKALDYMKRFREPRGAQTWELSLHTPDVLATAYLVEAYLRGYQITGREEYLTLARRWAVTGIPFVYLWQCKPIMLYATPPVYGASGYRAPNWMGLPVQWCGGVYAYALARLAPYDKTFDWRHLAEGIYVAAEQIQYPDGPRAGCLPDVFHVDSQMRDGPSINPAAILSLQAALEGQPDGLELAVSADHRVAAPYPVKITGHRAEIRAVAGRRYQVLVDGEVVDVGPSQGVDVVALHF